jgi:hypothetical protein
LSERVPLRHSGQSQSSYRARLEPIAKKSDESGTCFDLMQSCASKSHPPNISLGTITNDDLLARSDVGIRARVAAACEMLMKIENQSGKTSHHSPNDAIRIVPLHKAGAQAPAPTVAPKLVYRNGPLITSAEIFTIFWGSSWQQEPAASILAQMNQFFDFILTSSLMDQLAEYNVAGQSIGRGRRTGSITLPSPEPSASVTDQTIQQLLQREIASNAVFPQPSPNTLYFIFLPSGTVVVQGASSSCQQFCGYHDAIDSRIFYAVMPFPDCSGCLGSLAQIDALTSTSSHELCEAITDPIPGQGWYDDANGEIGDICAWKSKKLGNFELQLEWSNRADKCL